jgi:DNA mismatch repair protein MutL
MASFFSMNKSADPSQRRFDFSKVTRTSDSTATRQREQFYTPVVSLPALSLSNGSNPDSINSPQDEAALQTTGEPQRYLQIHDSFIITQTEDGFLIIDQHALHERIIYEDLCRRFAPALSPKGSGGAGRLESQKLLIPETFELTDAQIQILETNKGLLKRLGIELEPFGPGIWAVQAFPSLLRTVKPVEFLIDMLDVLTETAGKIDSERLLHKVLDLAACRAAVKAGQKLTPAEIGQLLADRQAIERASRCPHGRPTAIKFGLAELEKQFKRT